MGLHILKEETSHATVGALLNASEAAIYPLGGTYYVQFFGQTEIPIGLNPTQVSLIASALQPGDNISDLTNDQQYQTLTEVNNLISTAVNNLVNGAPGALDQLNELADALANDPNFATTITNALALKADKAIEINAGAGLTGGGDLTANRTIAMPSVGTAGTYGGAATVPVVTTDAQGRVSNVVNTAIQIGTGAVTGLAAFVRAVVLTGLTITNAVVTSGDTILSAIGKLQGQINTILGLIYEETFDRTDGLINQTATMEDYVNTSFTLPANGNYSVEVVGASSINATDNDFVAQVSVDGGTAIKMVQLEGKDAGGTGPTFNVIGGGTAATGTDQLRSFSFKRTFALNAGARNVTIQFAQGSAVGADEAAFHFCHVTIKRID